VKLENTTRTGIALLTSVILTVVISSGGLYIQGLISPNITFTTNDAYEMILIISAFYLALFGFFYWYIAYWQETKVIGKTEHEYEQDDREDREEDREEERQEYRQEDQGLRQFNDNDDWINMVPGDVK